MSASLIVVEPGLHTTVQDLGRTGWQRFGIPVSGALDAVALRVANVVVGNPQNTAALEVALMGPTLEVDAESVRVAAAGGTAAIDVLSGAMGGRRVPGLESVTLRRGDRFRLGATGGTAAAYIAIGGGMDLQPFLGSLSTYMRGNFGGFDGRALRKADRLPLNLSAAPDRPDMRLDGADLEPLREVRVVLGPQDDYFTEAAVRSLLHAEYTVSREADRMGLRLQGPVLEHAKGANIISDGIAPGAIQVPANGLPIILLADRQTTGGYPKIATVISADLPALGRVSPGAVLRFSAVSVEDAEAARRTLEAQLGALAENLTPVGPMGLELARLLEANLISGVIDGQRPDH